MSAELLIRSVEKITIGPGDILVVTLAHHASAAERAELRDGLRQVTQRLGHVVPIMVVDAPVTFHIIHDETGTTAVTADEGAVVGKEWV